MKNIIRLFCFSSACLVLCILVVGCESVQPVADNEPSIIIKKHQHRAIGLGRIVNFPIGVYAPDFNTQEGTYYLAPTKIIVSGLGMNRPRRGGLFVPAQYARDKRQGMWLDQEEDATLLTAGMSSTTSIWRFDEPVPFELLQPEGDSTTPPDSNQPIKAVPVPASPPITTKTLGF